MGRSSGKTISSNYRSGGNQNQIYQNNTGMTEALKMASEIASALQGSTGDYQVLSGQGPGFKDSNDKVGNGEFASSALNNLQNSFLAEALSGPDLKNLSPNDVTVTNSANYNPWATVKSNPSRVYSAYTAIPIDEPLIINSSEFLPIDDSTLIDKLEGSITAGLRDVSTYDRDYCLYLKEYSQNTIVQLSQQTLLESVHREKTCEKIQKNCRDYYKAADIQQKGSNLILKELARAIEMLDMRKAFLAMMGYIVETSFENENVDITQVRSNTLLYAYLISILKKSILAHVSSPAFAPIDSKKIAAYPYSNLLAFEVSRQTDPNPDQFILAPQSNVGNVIKNNVIDYFYNVYLLNRQKQYSIDVSIVDIACAGLEKAIFKVPTSQTTINNGLGVAGIKKSFSNTAEYIDDIDNIHRNFSTKLLRPSSVAGISTNPYYAPLPLQENLTKYYGLALYLFFKELRFSKAVKNAEIRKYLFEKFNYTPEIFLGQTKANFDVWDSLLGELSANPYSFTQDDSVDNANLANFFGGKSLISLTKQIKTTTAENSIAGVDNEYRILTLESGDVSKINDALTYVTPGAYYFFDSSLAGSPNAQGSITPDTSKVNELLKKLDRVNDSIVACRYLLAGSVQDGGVDLLLKQGPDLITAVSAYEVMRTTPLIKFYEENMRVVILGQNQNIAFGNLSSDLKTDAKLNFEIGDSSNANALGEKSSRLLASLIKRAWTLSYDSTDANRRNVGTKLLQAIFTVCMKYAFRVGANNGIIEGQYSAFKPKFNAVKTIEYFGFEAEQVQYAKPNFNGATPELSKDIDLKNRKLFFETLLGTNGNANRPELAIDALIYSNPDIFNVTADSYLEKDEYRFETATHKTAQGENVSKFLRMPSTNRLLLEGKSFFQEHISCNYESKKNSLLETISSLINEFIKSNLKNNSPTGSSAFRDSGGTPLDPIYTAQSITAYGAFTSASIFWTYFMFICDAIRRLTPEMLMGVYDYSITPINGYSTSYSGYYTKLYEKDSNICLKVDNNFIYYPLDEALPEQNKSAYSYKVKFNDAFIGVIENFSQHRLGTSTNLEIVSTYIDGLKSSTQKFIDFLSKPNEPVKQYYNYVNSAADTSVSSLESPEDRSSLKQYLVSNSLTQEQLALSYHISDEIIQRVSLPQKNNINDAAKSLNLIYKTSALYPSFYSSKLNENFSVSDFLPLNSTDSFAYNNLVRHYLLKNDFAYKEYGENRRILSIGIPPRMIRTLSGSPSLLTGDSYYDTIIKNLITIKIYKHDPLNTPGLRYLPKIFNFDMFRFSTRNIAAYKNVNSEGSLDDLIASIPTKLYVPPMNSVSNASVQLNWTNNGLTARYYALAEYKNILNNSISKEVIEQIYNNHVESFLLEEYINLFTRARLDETYFNHYVDLDSSLKYSNLQFEDYLTTTDKKFDSTNLSANEQNLSFKSIKTREKSIRRYFSNETLFIRPEEIRKRIFMPKKFDRVFSVAIDPDDFELDQYQFLNENGKELKDSFIAKGILEEVNGFVRKVRKYPWGPNQTSAGEIYINEFWVEIEPFAKGLDFSQQT